MLKIQALASGSKGNCTYIASDTTRILVDVGLSLPQMLLRLQAAGIDPSSINAILVTHEHSDHIGGVRAFLKRFKCKIYLAEPVVNVCCHEIGMFDPCLLMTFHASFTVGDITVNFFPVPHDSNFCFGYTFQKDNCKISIATDLGRISPAILAAMADSQVILLECNHDITKLNNNVKYPPHLKRRIMGSNGHLSNAACSLAVYELVKYNVQQIILAHLSEENNTPTLAYTFVRDYLKAKGLEEGVDISIDIAHQNKVSTVFQID